MEYKFMVSGLCLQTKAEGNPDGIVCSTAIPWNGTFRKTETVAV